MNSDQVGGAARNGGGHIEEAAGSVTKNRRLKNDGVVDQVKGKAQSLIGDAKEAVRGTYDRVAPATRDSFDRVITVTRDHSMLAILAAGAVGFALAVAFRNSGTSTSVQEPWSA